MKRLGIILLMVMTLFFMQMSNVFAEGRSIYIGDELVLEIHDETLSEAEIKKAFEDFRVVDMESVEGGYRVTVSPLEPGKQEVQLKHQRLIVDVKSTLDEIQRDSIFEKELETGHFLNRNLVYALLSICATVAVVSNTIWGVGLLRKKKKEMVTPYERFVEEINGLDEIDKNVLGEITKLSKAYLSNRSGISIIGLTTKQMRDVDFVDLQESAIKSKYFDWLKACDDMKFKGHALKRKDLLHMRDQLKSIVTEMEAYFVQEENRSVVKDAV